MQEFLPLISHCKPSRRLAVAKVASKRKTLLGQFFTPEGIARFMAGLFSSQPREHCRLLDPGAGMGSLSAAFLERCFAGELEFQRIEVDAFEVDRDLHPSLSQILGRYRQTRNVISTLREDDFIITAVNALDNGFFTKTLEKYTHVIMNPPYKKIRSDSEHRLALRQLGIETGNLYSAFVALALLLLEDGGQLVAIVPRSFCNGPYFRPFREHIFTHTAIRHIHLFTSRNAVFKEDDVLQENIIILLERGATQKDVTITTSHDDTFSDMETHRHPFDRIVFPNDPERFIHIPTSPELNVLERMNSVRYTIEDVGVTVSTGPVVDYRMKKHLRNMPEPGTIPLLYPTHFNGWNTHWPKPDMKKPNAIRRNDETEKWLYPNGFYCVVRRFSSKEEKRRIMASVIHPDDFPGVDVLGVENHLNIYHENRHGLSEELAHGLAAFLNTTAVDEYFRRFNGHTQVNATDLKRIQYPNRKKLIALGKWVVRCKKPSQAAMDDMLESMGQDE